MGKVEKRRSYSDTALGGEGCEGDGEAGLILPEHLGIYSSRQHDCRLQRDSAWVKYRAISFVLW